MVAQGSCSKEGLRQEGLAEEADPAGIRRAATRTNGGHGGLLVMVEAKQRLGAGLGDWRSQREQDPVERGARYCCSMQGSRERSDSGLGEGHEELGVQRRHCSSSSRSVQRRRLRGTTWLLRERLEAQWWRARANPTGMGHRRRNIDGLAWTEELGHGDATPVACGDSSLQ